MNNPTSLNSTLPRKIKHLREIMTLTPFVTDLIAATPLQGHLAGVVADYTSGELSELDDAKFTQLREQMNYFGTSSITCSPNITDQAVKALVRQFPDVTRLSMQGCHKVSRWGVRATMELPLQYLNLQGTGIIGSDIGNVLDRTHCQWKLVYPGIPGAEYEGEWTGAYPHGPGVFRDWEKDCVQEGTFVHGQLHGKGTRRNLRTHYVEEGTFSHSQLHGKGKRMLRDTFCSGDFVDGTLSGEGVGVLAYGVKYKGNYHSSYPHGHGTSIYPNGTTYTGNMDMGLTSGFGTFTYPNGMTYTGNVQTALAEGLGTLTLSDGRAYTGTFTKGRHGQPDFPELPDHRANS